MGWLILVVLLALLVFAFYRAWSVWQEKFANRHELDSAHLALLIAHREELESPLAHTEKPAARKHKEHRPSRKEQFVRSIPAALGGQALPATARKPLLAAAAQEVFLRLHSELPGYPILSGVDIAVLLDAQGVPPPRVQVDFVLCKKDFSPAVAIFIEHEPSNPMIDRVVSLLREQRVRVLRWQADALPEREQMRHQIFKPKSRSQ